jgi:hypothetical protein
MSAFEARPILVDTNVILEAHRCQCWKALAGGLQLETVEMCVAEAYTGHQRRRNQLIVDPIALRNSFHAIHSVSKLEAAAIALMDGPALDVGERELWAHAIHRPDVWVLCGPDAASMRFGYMHGFRDRMLSLEDLLRSVGSKIPGDLRAHYKTAWLRSLFGTLALERN